MCGAWNPRKIDRRAFSASCSWGGRTLLHVHVPCPPLKGEMTGMLNWAEFTWAKNGLESGSLRPEEVQRGLWPVTGPGWKREVRPWHRLMGYHVAFAFFESTGMMEAPLPSPPETHLLGKRPPKVGVQLVGGTRLMWGLKLGDVLRPSWV